jgi:hypothetical protein
MLTQDDYIWIVRAINVAAKHYNGIVITEEPGPVRDAAAKQEKIYATLYDKIMEMIQAQQTRN